MNKTGRFSNSAAMFGETPSSKGGGNIIHGLRVLFSPTPHPGPLPVEGRGSATKGVGEQDVSGRAHCDAAIWPQHADAAACIRYSTRVHRDSLSPQRGEGWEWAKVEPFTWSLKFFRVLVCLAAVLLLAAPAALAEDTATFDAANKLYEQGKFIEAAAAYQQLLPANPRSETLCFNLGNARFKAGQIGRAIAAYRQAERLSPREPGVRFNLQFARKKVSGGDAPVGPAWQRASAALTLNEWTLLAAAALWLWFVLLALREWRPSWRSALSGYTATTGGVLLLLVGCVAAAANFHFNTTAAVVVVQDAILRSGPLEEAKVLRQLRDGVEVTVLDQKELALGDQKQTWLQVRDGANAPGWLKSDQVIVLR